MGPRWAIAFPGYDLTPWSSVSRLPPDRRPSRTARRTPAAGGSPLPPGLDFHPDAELPPIEPLTKLLADLCSRELTRQPAGSYLHEHATSAAVHGQVTMFRWYWPWIAPARSVLDWGCQ